MIAARPLGLSTIPDRICFYTDDILVTGGPEGIHGLPGLILGVGIPRLHTTWFATKVETNGVPTSQILPATKVTKVDYKK